MPCSVREAASVLAKQKYRRLREALGNATDNAGRRPFRRSEARHDPVRLPEPVARRQPEPVVRRPPEPAVRRPTSPINRSKQPVHPPGSLSASMNDAPRLPVTKKGPTKKVPTKKYTKALPKRSVRIASIATAKNDARKRRG